MPKLIPKARRREYRVECTSTTLPTDTVSDESKAIENRLSRDETEKLTRARRQNSRAEPGPPKIDPPTAPPSKKTRSWLRFFGIGSRLD